MGRSLGVRMDKPIYGKGRMPHPKPESLQRRKLWKLIGTLLWAKHLPNF